MNVLVHDIPSTVAFFVRSVLRSHGHRVALSEGAEDAAFKLDTAIFDAVVFGPQGPSRQLADFVQRQFPQMPVVLAGVPVEVEPAGQVAAVLPAPLSARRLEIAFRRLQRRREDLLRSLPVEVAAEGLAIACGLADLTPDTLVLAGDSDEFHRYFGAGPARVRAVVGGSPLEGPVAANETDPTRRRRRVDVRLEEGSAREVLKKLLR
jgi:hypothetical protein